MLLGPPAVEVCPDPHPGEGAAVPSSCCSMPVEFCWSGPGGDHSGCFPLSQSELRADSPGQQEAAGSHNV
jgi:hypothetical protein